MNDTWKMVYQIGSGEWTMEGDYWYLMSQRSIVVSMGAKIVSFELVV